MIKQTFARDQRFALDRSLEHDQAKICSALNRRLLVFKQRNATLAHDQANVLVVRSMLSFFFGVW